ncbi:hypothetical protein EIP91_005935 [Steccherinum ochraceum]|uniref:ER membrane protein complex subunit 2 n=1 Tax=Steccherinum ochraceum TaxID=92696 RepID=A0A4R0RZC6_9APHY|nr:hypothetical protein EIP91_005935 [Steccherinum ochraceum]
MDWKAMWKTGVLLMNEFHEEDMDSNSKRLDYLSTLMLQYPEERQAIFQELILRYILSGEYGKALDELELYLPSQPYASNPILQIYGGLICLYLAQPESTFVSTWDAVKLRDAQAYLEKAKTIDPNNVVALAWLEQIPRLQSASTSGATTPMSESDDEEDKRRANPRAKRARR